ncbi:MAG: DUF1995 family protein [Gloeomargaritaceae cyanobacterium C42_A2020_066]|nr:DUF1995 family protein [Gloeomargaritaceae cyanobacterium C42_A2020_066]
MSLPDTLDQAVAQAQAAQAVALAAGRARLRIDLLLPELKPMAPALQLATAWAGQISPLRVVFPDAGAAALARRDWGTVPFQISDLRERLTPEVAAVLLVAPTAPDVEAVERLAQTLDGRLLVMFNGVLEDAGTVGIGLAGRRLRERFLNTFEVCYHLQPLDEGALSRTYPGPWQVWRETDQTFQLLAELDGRPNAEALEELFIQGTDKPRPAGGGFLARLDRFLRILQG